VKNFFLEKLNKFKKKIAIINEDNSKINYSELFEQSKKLSIKFKKKLNIIICTNSYEFIVFYIASALSNSTSILIDSTITEINLKNVVKSYKPNYIFFPKFKKFFFRGYNNYFNYNNYNILKKTKKINHKLNKKISYLLSTSGSMGHASFVKLSKENLHSNALSITKYLKIKKTDLTITNLKTAYSYGLSNINIHLMNGGSIVLTEKSILDKEFWELFLKYKVTNFHGVPFTYEILEKLKFRKLFKKHLKFLTQAGGNLNLNLKKKIIKLSKKNKNKFFVMYGQTEASPRMTYIEKKNMLKKENSVGEAVYGGKIYITNDVGAKVKTNILGNIMYKGKNVFLGYSSNYKDLNKIDNTQVLNTGDIGKLDNEKFLYIYGRKKRIIKLFGNRYSLDKIEQSLKDKGINSVCKISDSNLEISIVTKHKNINIKKIIYQITGIKENYVKLKYIKKINLSYSGKVIFN
jgi:acyl-CoA synthetase (AMP-forming)/AMP-acid ligase II